MARVHFLPEIRRRETLDCFIDRHLRMPITFKSKINQTINHLARHLETVTGFKVDKVIRSGSIAKGTAVNTHTDIDLVVFISGYCSMVTSTRKKTMKHFVDDKTIPGGIIDTLNCHLTSDAVYLRNWTCCKVTDYHIRLQMVEYPEISVDIVPAIDTISDNGGNMKSVFDNMQKHPEKYRRHFSSCLAEKQCEFIKKQPKKVRDLIKLVKYWKKRNNLDLELRSYFCELLTVHVFLTDLQKDSSFNIQTGFKAVLGYLKSYNSLQITFNDYYIPTKWEKEFPTPPYVMDPVNPFMNTCKELAPDEVNIITSCATSTCHVLL